MMASIRPPENPLARYRNEYESDRLLLNDITPYGLRRQVIARRGGIPNMVTFLQQAFEQAGAADVQHWLIQKEPDDGFWYLWIVWKEKA